MTDDSVPSPPARGSRLDPFLDAYAERARTMIASEIRALFSVADTPRVLVRAPIRGHAGARPVRFVSS